MNKKLVWTLLIVIGLLASAAAYCAQSRTAPPADIATPHTIKAAGTIQVGFSPHGGITDMIVAELNAAKKSIEVQAYSFTSAPIAKALTDAWKRGVKVRVILDESQESGRYTVATYLRNAGVPLHIDRAFAIAHSKIMIVDGAAVITGSFNFTKAAEENNAENCLILRGNPALVALYEKNWQWRWNATN